MLRDPRLAHSELFYRKKWVAMVVMVRLMHSKSANRVRIQTFQWQKSGQHTLAAKKLFFLKCLYFMQSEKVKFF